MNGPFLKDPGDRLDYIVDFNALGWLGEEDTIASVLWEVPTGLTQYAIGNDDTTATIWLAGGAHVTDYTVTCQVTTTGGRVKQQSFTIQVRNNVA
jgi:hypothetical protein